MQSVSEITITIEKQAESLSEESFGALFGDEKAKERLESAEKGKLQIVTNFREGLNQVEQSQLSKVLTRAPTS